MFDWFRTNKNRTIVYHSVDLGLATVNIPVAHIVGNAPGPHMLVVGGMDGDEYAGIEACYQLIERYTSGDFCGELTIIPVLNVPGFFNETSINPLDACYPKYVFPGKEKGTPTERLVHWLSSTYAGTVSVWVELHDGALTESVRPLVWFPITSVDSIDATTEHILSTIRDAIIICDRTEKSDRRTLLAHKGTAFVITESGSRGSCTQEAVDRHIAWTESIMGAIHMVPSPADEQPAHTQPRISRVRYVYAPWDGIGYPAILGERVEKGQRVTKVYSLDRKKVKEFCAPETGIVLWRKETPAVRKYDILCAIGIEEKGRLQNNI